MSGIAGIYVPSGGALESVNAAIRQMTATLAHRGPNCEAYWIESGGLLGFGHRLLAVAGSDATGTQPMHSPSGRFVLAFSGAVYNHFEIREQLESKEYAQHWRGTSDVNALAMAIEVWGLRQAIEKVSGMFACAVWDRSKRELTLIRDRMGEQPLYYGWCGNTFAFASELRAIESLPGAQLTVDPAALAQYLRFTYVPGPKSIYAAIMKLPPGCLATVRPEPRHPPDIQQYWSLLDCAQAGLAAPFLGDEIEAETELARFLARSVNRRIFVDVPVGAFLSGGVDSAAVVSEMVQQTSQKVNTFTLGFGQAGYDETEEAHRVAERLGTVHHKAVISEKEAMRVVPVLGSLYDEPFADSSQIPTVLISRFARQSVTIALCGDGGDELLGGYPRHARAARWFQRVGCYPIALRSPIGTSLRYLLNAAGYLNTEMIPAASDIVRKLAKIAAILRARNLAECYLEWVSHWQPADQILRAVNQHAGRNEKALALNPDIRNDARELMLIDSLTSLVDDMLVKVDRAAMSVSLEMRAPFLDHELIEFAWTLPNRFLMDGFKRKCLLRTLVEKRIEPVRLTTSKTGFSVPLGSWLRGGLRDWAEDTLNAQPPAAAALLNDKVIKKVWRMHLRGAKNNSSLLWAVLMFKSWAGHRMQ
jgi:asparagine synthase (glutamine-hydrolysing)